MQKKEKAVGTGISLNPVKSIVARGYFIAMMAVIIVLLASYISSIPGSRNSLTDQAENNMLDLSQSYIKILEARISAINDTVAYMSTDGDIYSYLSHGGESFLVTSALKMFIRDNPEYLYAAMYDKNGKFVTSSSDTYSKEDNPYYVNAAMSLQRPMPSDYIEVDNTACIISAVPLINAGNLMGCVTITVPVDLFTTDMSSVKLQDIESSFAYLITPLGHFLYHPDEQYIGQITGEESIRNLIAQGNVLSAIAHFDFEGSKIAALAASETNGWTLVIQADKSELLKPVNHTVVKSIIFCIVIAVVVSIAVYFAIYAFLHPIVGMTREISNIASLDFTSKQSIDKLTKDRTEIGTMAREIKRMHDNIKSVISNLNDVTDNITSGNNTLSNIASSLNDYSTENSAVSQELASGMKETTDTVDEIKNEVNTIKLRTAEINQQSQNTIALSEEITNHASDARKSMLQAADTTRSVYSKVSDEAHVALEQSKSVAKINDLSQNIYDIAEQTSLLALNASIEAARAGKYGRGFAVVAQEISNLAEQSSTTVTDIFSIVTEVTNAVGNIDACLTKTLAFIDSSIMKDYDSFAKIIDSYHEDAQSFQRTINEITTSLGSLETATNGIAHAVSGMNITIGESSEGVSTIAQRTSEVVELSGNTYNQVKQNGKMADTLRDIVDKFKL